MFNDNPFRDIKTNPILPITEGDDKASKASKQAKAAAEDHMIGLYGKGRVTYSSHSGGHFVEHESEDGNTHGHTFNPETGKISKTPHVTSSYYGESVTNPILPITEKNLVDTKNFDLRTALAVAQSNPTTARRLRGPSPSRKANKIEKGVWERRVGNTTINDPSVPEAVRVNAGRRRIRELLGGSEPATPLTPQQHHAALVARDKARREAAPVDTNEEVQLDEFDIHKIKNFLRAAGVVTGMATLGGTLAALNGMRHARWDGRQEPTVASNVATGVLGAGVGAGAGGLVAAGLVPSRPPRVDRRRRKPVNEEVSQLAEGWNDRLEDVTGFTWIDKDHPMYKPKHDPKNTGSHYHNHNTGEGMSEAKVFKLYDRLNSISADNAYAGLNPTGKGTPEGPSDHRDTDLFPKNREINIREHIRNEYSNRGYDATTVEVQETYNHVVSMLNERDQANKEASRVAEIERGWKVLGLDYGFEEDAISAARNSKAGLDPKNSFTRRSEHKTKRGEKKISPSSPAREISKIERETRRGT